MVKFKALGYNKKVRDVIIASGITVNIYEPSLDDVSKILDLQERWVSLDTPEVVTVDGVDVIRELFPILTDIQGIEELSDEEINEVIENPSVAYMQTQIVVETILREIFQTHVLEARLRLADANFNYEAELTNRDTFNRAVAMEVKNSGTTEIVDKINRMADSIEKQAEIEEGKRVENRVIQLNKMKNDTDKQIENVQKENKKLLEQYERSFAENTDKE